MGPHPRQLSLRNTTRTYDVGGASLATAANGEADREATCPRDECRLAVAGTVSKAPALLAILVTRRARLRTSYDASVLAAAAIREVGRLAIRAAPASDGVVRIAGGEHRIAAIARVGNNALSENRTEATRLVAPGCLERVNSQTVKVKLNFLHHDGLGWLWEVRSRRTTSNYF